ncbi:hypothetical protein [Paenibacillus chitinolyticus]
MSGKVRRWPPSEMLKKRRNSKVFNRKGDLIRDIGVKEEQLDKEEKLRSKTHKLSII